MSNLPRDIIINILLTLPVKSLSKLKCVSKSWCSLISDPYFIMKHLHCSSNYRIMMECKDPKSNIKSFPLRPVFNEPLSAYIDAIDHNNHPRKEEVICNVQMVGSCNGMVLINIDKNLIDLWNPTTGESKRIPSPEFKWSRESYIKYGFGYDKYSKDYKVAAIFKSTSNIDGEMKVYSLKDNSWSAPEPCPGRLLDVVFVDDELAFVLLLLNDRFVLGNFVFQPYTTIVAYDLSTETYQKLPQPDTGHYNQLGVLGGNICFIAQFAGQCYPMDLITVDIWVMKKYGVGESWTKVITVPYLKDFTDRTYYFDKVLWLPKKIDQVLVTNTRKFFLYNDTDSTLRKLEIKNLDSHETALVYVESLVSPNCFEQKVAVMVD